MRYPTMTASDASTCLTARRGGVLMDGESLVKTKGAGPDFNSSFVGLLREAFGALRAAWPDGLKNDRERNLFEGKASRVVHGSVPAGSEILCDAEFWIWLSVIHFPELIEWRYSNPRDGAKPANYGIGSRTENLLFRLWLRAELVFDESAEDPYHLAETGQIDFYRSHLFRQGYASARNFARALLRFQYPNPDPSAPKLKTREIRDLAKRLSRMRSNLFLEILREEECRAVIEAEAAVVVSG